MRAGGTVKSVGRILRILVVAYVGLCVFVYVIQSSYVYEPSMKFEFTPADMKAPYEDLTIETSDGVLINAWFLPVKNARGSILFCHGNAGNMGNRLESIAFFRAQGLSVLIFDYRGYGQSEGKPSEKGTRLDAQTMWDFLTEVKGIPPSNIVVFGRSLGGAVAAQLAADNNPAGLIVESAFTSAPDMARTLFPYLPVRLLCRFSYDTESAIRRVKCPVLVVHSREDEMVPYGFGKRIFEAAPDPKTFLTITGTHNSGPWFSGRKYDDGVIRFLNRVFSPSEAP